MSEFRLRSAREEDTEPLADTVRQGFETYREFAPKGWQAPEIRAEQLRELMSERGRWCVVAEKDGEVVGHVAVMPARQHFIPDPEPGLAHLGQLFVRQPYWGSGLATRLLGSAVAEALARGFEEMRLFAPRDSARAIRFYEREGFLRAGQPFLSEELANGLWVAEYRRTLVVDP